MRATITVPDDLFLAADRHARELGISRSRLYQEALEHYLRSLEEAALTQQADRHIETYGQPVSPRFQEYVAEAWRQDMGEDDW